MIAAAVASKHRQCGSKESWINSRGTEPCRPISGRAWLSLCATKAANVDAVDRADSRLTPWRPDHEPVRQALYRKYPSVEHVGVDHCRTNVLVTKEADIDKAESIECCRLRTRTHACASDHSGTDVPDDATSVEPALHYQRLLA